MRIEYAISLTRWLPILSVGGEQSSFYSQLTNESTCSRLQRLTMHHHHFLRHTVTARKKIQNNGVKYTTTLSYGNAIWLAKN